MAVKWRRDETETERLKGTKEDVLDICRSLNHLQRQTPHHSRDFAGSDTQAELIDSMWY